ncbi:hypothetical protein PIIN_04036 [Serendipita indica DSM 11827]|uniref:F-box domain-containing protein n=1 Tax=Serendipita indica (strain DSM 11827) TaxID=1109443 RepID=G4TFM1_SERID|nr:hypothetical protein PIIN_04036 [Serendipita indica DSM 11827]
MEPASLRAPVEIWRIIFHLYLGPSVPDVEQVASLQEFGALLSRSKIVRMYLKYEQARSTLSLVCRKWQQLADQMEGRRIVESCGDTSYVWPPNADISKADRIHYRPLSEQRTYRTVSNQRPRPDLYVRPIIQVGFSEPLAKTMMFESCYFVTPANTGVTCYQTSPVRALGIECSLGSISSDHYTLQAIYHPVFRQLTVLSLFIDFPFPPGPSPGNLVLRELKCLILRFSVNCSNQYGAHGTLSTWKFPGLKMLRLSGCFAADGQTEINEFFNRHGEHLEELDYSVRCHRIPHIVHEWKILHHLKTYYQDSLSQMAGNLRLLEDWVATHLQPLRIILNEAWMWECRNESTFYPTLQAHRMAISMVHFVLPHRWSYYAELFGPTKSTRGHLSMIEEMQSLLTVVEDAGTRVEDVLGQPHNSDSAAEFLKRLWS